MSFWNEQADKYLPGLAAIAVLVSCIFFTWRLRRWYREAGRAGVLAKARATKRWVYDMLFPECPYDPLQKKVKEIEQSRCVRVWRINFRAFHAYNTARLASMAWGYSQGVESLNDTAWAGFSYLACLVMDVFYCLINVCTIRLLVVVAMAQYIWNITLTPSDTYGDWDELLWTHYISFALIWRMNLSVVYADFPAVIGVNFVCSMTCITMCPYQGATDLEMFGFFMIMLGASFNKNVRITEICATLEATHSQNFLNAMDALLSNVCDVVLHLSHDFRILRPSPRFSTMLFKASPHSMKGDMLMDFLRDDDEAVRVTAFFGRADVAAATMHTSFKDSHGANVRVQLFHARGFDINDEAFHVVGVLETVETQRPFSPEGDRFEMGIPVVGTLSEDAKSKRSEDVKSKSSHGSDGSSSHVGSKIVWVDPLAEGLPIVKSSAEFAVFWPCSDGARFLDFVSNKGDLIQELRHPHQRWDDEEPFQLRLRLPDKGSVRADVEVEEDEGSDGRTLAKLTVRNVQKGNQKHVSKSPRKPNPRPAGEPGVWEQEAARRRAVARAAKGLAPAAKAAKGPAPSKLLPTEPLTAAPTRTALAAGQTAEHGPQSSSWQKPEGTAPLPVPGVDAESGTVLCLDVSKGRFAVMDVSHRGQGADLRGVQVGDAFLHWFADPDRLQLAVIGGLLNECSWENVRPLLEDASTNMEAYMKRFQPTNIGMFSLNPSKTTSSRFVEVVVVEFFTYMAGDSIGCTLFVGHEVSSHSI